MTKKLTANEALALAYLDVCHVLQIIDEGHSIEDIDRTALAETLADIEEVLGDDIPDHPYHNLE